MSQRRYVLTGITHSIHFFYISNVVSQLANFKDKQDADYEAEVEARKASKVRRCDAYLTWFWC